MLQPYIESATAQRMLLHCYIRECGSTLYVGLQHAIPPTNTKFKPLLLPTQVGIPSLSM